MAVLALAFIAEVFLSFSHIQPSYFKRFVFTNGFPYSFFTLLNSPHLIHFLILAFSEMSPTSSSQNGPWQLQSPPSSNALLLHFHKHNWGPCTRPQACKATQCVNYCLHYHSQRSIISMQTINFWTINSNRESMANPSLRSVHFHRKQTKDPDPFWFLCYHGRKTSEKRKGWPWSSSRGPRTLCPECSWWLQNIG